MALIPSVEEQREVVRTWLGAGSLNIFGVQFAGKDTQCQRLASWLHGVVLGGGDILRKRSDLPDAVRAIMERGELIPIKDYLAIVTPYLAQPDFADRPLLLSAVGRFRGEEEGVLQAAEAARHPLRAAVLLELDEANVWKRWRLMDQLKDRDKRTDDSEEGLRMRLQEYEAKTLPVLDFYRQRGLLVAVDGSRTPDEVEMEILQALYARATSA